MTTFKWIDPQIARILFSWAPVGAKKLGVRFESRSAVGVSFSTSNTLPESQEGVPSQGGQHREEHSVVHHVREEHY